MPAGRFPCSPSSGAGGDSPPEVRWKPPTGELPHSPDGTQEESSVSYPDLQPTGRSSGRPKAVIVERGRGGELAAVLAASRAAA